jgi:hypothetical protein
VPKTLRTVSEGSQRLAGTCFGSCRPKAASISLALLSFTTSRRCPTARAHAEPAAKTSDLMFRSIAARASTRVAQSHASCDASRSMNSGRVGAALLQVCVAPEALAGGGVVQEFARQIRTFWALMPQGRLLPLSWMVDPCLRSARPFGLVGPLRATSALAVTRMASGLPCI